VQWTDGFRLDLPRLGVACTEGSVLFFVDAIQQFGALPLDVSAAHIDALAAGSHKWQMGPEGMGVFYCSPRARERLSLRQFGWRMLDHPYRFDAGEEHIATSARRFETGSPNTMGQLALAASLGVLERAGIETVGQRVLDNSRRLVDATRDIPGLWAVSDTRPGRLSGIVTIGHERSGAAELNRALKLRFLLGRFR
jgi:selenocysteine lyase/cysteine desulfurase